MLINPLYLNRRLLTDFVASVEGGVRESVQSRSEDDHSLGGSLNVSAVKVEGRKGAKAENTLTLSDHDASRLERLIEAGHTHADKLDWVEVLDPDTDFAALRLGNVLEWECDIYVPEELAALANAGGMQGALQLMQELSPMAKTLGLDMSGIPEADELQAMSGLLERLDIPPIVVGDDSDTAWRLVGVLDKQWLAPDAVLDARVRVVAKVKKHVSAGRWYPLPALPGVNLVARDERRRMERNGPQNDDERGQFIEGPLLVVDFLAIYS